MNVNEVIARLATFAWQGSRGVLRPARPIDAHDDVNRGQSSNDVFPSAMHLAVALLGRRLDLPLVPAASQGQFELNVFKLLIALDALDSGRLLADAMRSFVEHCVAGLAVNAARLAQQLQGSLMLATALTPHIGYARAAEVATQAQATGSTLREAALALGTTSAQDFDRWVDPRAMAAAGIAPPPMRDHR